LHLACSRYAAGTRPGSTLNTARKPRAQAKQAKVVLVPSEEAWTLVDWAKLLASGAEPTAAQKEAVLQTLALHHLSYDPLTITQLAAASSSSVSASASALSAAKGVSLSSALGQSQKASTWSCQQKVGVRSASSARRCGVVLGRIVLGRDAGAWRYQRRKPGIGRWAGSSRPALDSWVWCAVGLCVACSPHPCTWQL
jgi:hypothetical protein